MAVQNHFAVLATVALYLILCAEVSASPPHDQPLTRAVALALNPSPSPSHSHSPNPSPDLPPSQVSASIKTNLFVLKAQLCALRQYSIDPRSTPAYHKYYMFRYVGRS